MASVKDLPALSVRRPYLAAVLNLLIIVAGIAAVFGVEVRELPDIDRPVVTVRANYPGASPETIDAEVTAVVEGAVARVNGVTEVRSSSEENNFRIRVVFQPDVDLVDAANDVREAVSRVARQLPEGVRELFVIKADSDASPIIRLSVYSDRMAIEDVTRLVENEIVPEFIAVDGVADVRIFGRRKQVLRVVLDPMRMASYGISVSEVADVLRNARYDVPAGSFKSQEQEVIVRADASVVKPEEVEKLVVRDPVRVGDVATAYFGPADPVSYVRLNGRTVLNLGIIRRARSNTVAISAEVDRMMQRLNRDYPQLTIVKTSDDAIFIRGAIREVLISLTLAVLIVVAVITIFVGQFRAALIPAVAIPIALIGTIASIWMLGFSINLVTLLALVLCAGLVVDDAIVVLENIQRQRAFGVARHAASVIGTRQVFFAVIATTATLISVFIPISFLPSRAGRLFAEFGFVLAVTVSISSFVALTMVPMLAANLRISGNKKPGLVNRLLQGIGRQFARVYGVVLGWVLAAPLVLLGISAVFAVSAAIVYENLGEELVPREDRGFLSIWLTGPDGTGLDYTDRQVEKAEAILRPYVRDGVVTNLLTITGRYDANRGQITTPLVDWSKRTVSEHEVVQELNKELRKIPGARSFIWRGNSLGLYGAGRGITFALTGSNYERIAEAADDFVLAMERAIPQLSNFRIEFRATQPQLAVSIDRRRAADLGVKIGNLASTVQVLVDNDEIGELTVDDQAIPIILQAKAGAIDDPSDLRNLYVSAADGNLVPLSQLVTFQEKAVPAELDRHGQRRAVEIRAALEDGYTLRNAVDAVRKLGADKLPPGIGLMFLYSAAALEETSQGMTITYAIAFIVMFLVLVAQFEGIASALVVLLTVPFGVAVAVFALALTGTSINIYSQIGVLLLIGIMAKNSILMVEFADQLREQGRSVIDAAREASQVRLRPIVMTMISTILAGLPLILGSGPGSEARAAIGWVVFGGLGLAAIFTLFLTPALYMLICTWSRPRNRVEEALSSELEQAQTMAEQQQPAE